MAEWQKIVALAERVPDLERRIAALEAGAQNPAPRRPSRQLCLLCGAATSVTGVRPHPTLRAFGVKELTLTCNNPACRHVTTAEYDPAKP